MNADYNDGRRNRTSAIKFRSIDRFGGPVEAERTRGKDLQRSVRLNNDLGGFAKFTAQAQVTERASPPSSHYVRFEEPGEADNTEAKTSPTSSFADLRRLFSKLQKYQIDIVPENNSNLSRKNARTSIQDKWSTSNSKY